MNKKYYVTWGPYHKLLMRNRPLEACRDLMRLTMENHSQDEGFTVPIVFRISERGFAEHDDDIYLTTHDIVSLLSNNLDQKEK